MDVSIHFQPDMEAAEVEIEDALDEALAELGEVAGGSVGAQGMTIDLDVEDDVDREELLQLIRGALKIIGVTPQRMVIEGRPY